MKSWLLLNSGRGEAAFNMALDEALLDAAARLGQPVLRFYDWTEPAATFGYFQKFADVERITSLRPLIRRPTGGGIVPHDADWTYSFIVPPGHEWYLLKAEESYRRIHEWIKTAFARLQIETELAPSSKVVSGKRKTESNSALRTSTLRSKATAEDGPHSALPSACFVGHEKFDLLWRGKKIAGAAQRRNKLGLLIQGSVQPPAFRTPHSALRTPRRVDWENSMRAVAENQFGVRWQALSLDAELRTATERLAREKFSQAGHNRKR